MGWFKKLIFWYLIFVIVKSILSYFIPSPSAFSDEYLYAKTARDLFYSFSFNSYDIGLRHYPPLYPILLSITYFFKNMNIIYPAMKILNAIVSSLIIFPSWLLAKEFMSKRKAFYISLMISILPSNFSFSEYLMSENLFYPLFLFSIYFLYKAFTKNNYLFNILAGVFIGLSSLTRNLGIGLMIPVIILLFVYPRKKHFLILLSSLIFILPWMLRNLLTFGFNIGNIFGGYRPPPGTVFSYGGFLSFVTWGLLYLGYFVLASGIIFPLTSFNYFNQNLKFKKVKIYFVICSLTFVIFLGMLAKHNVGLILYDSFFSWLSGRPLGRYLDQFLPLILISGFAGFKIKKTNKTYLVISSLILAFSSQLAYFSLFPINNMSLTWLGIISMLIHSKLIILLFLAALPFIVYILYFKLDRRKLIAIFFTIFLIFSLGVYSINYYSSKNNWYETKHTELGLWVDKNLPINQNILFDEANCVEDVNKENMALCSRSFTPSGFWMNHNLIIGDVFNLSEDADYIISERELEYFKLKEIDGINIYKSK